MKRMHLKLLSITTNKFFLHVFIEKNFYLMQFIRTNLLSFKDFEISESSIAFHD